MKSENLRWCKLTGWNSSNLWALAVNKYIFFSFWFLIKKPSNASSTPLPAWWLVEVLEHCVCGCLSLSFDKGTAWSGLLKFVREKGISIQTYVQDLVHWGPSAFSSCSTFRNYFQAKRLVQVFKSDIVHSLLRCSIVHSLLSHRILSAQLHACHNACVIYPSPSRM